jgi:hypothetical protein
MKTALMVAIGLAAIGCGSKATDAASPGARGFGQDHAVPPAGHHDTAKPADGEADHHGHMEKMSPLLAKFHDTLAPRWHAEHGPQRIADTCGAMAQFHADADALAASPPPSGADAAAWASGGKQLTESVAALDAACHANDAAAFEPAFARVHHDFHGMMEAVGGHERHEDHEHKK